MKTTIAFFIALVASAAAHMEITNPPPLRSKNNPNTPDPLTADGSNYPCKGYLADTEGKESVATWTAGSTQSITLAGSAIHEGGSCQFSISEDEGASFKVIKSFIGNCPASTGPLNMTVDVPTDVATGEAIFAWTWNNRVGNREFYMNCAIITIEGGGAGLSTYPDVLVAQLSGINTCTIAEGVDVDYPNPGTQVERADADTAIGAPEGDCGGSGTATSGSASSGVSATASASVGATVGAKRTHRRRQGERFL
ncbi:hypothetical protein BD626DRAFT_549397 [Schizophyllum amplum]|uniref:Chitin-binding type-4 domain-containing protein n=1 Tax=Schizophyllum amplum TaxID=97359 RepID=A0A550C7Y9_9AGAR|nr:hypothetical protein BD626DRAFT_549397 [Auriculariopsis ampla]